MSVANYFSSDFFEARAKFLGASGTGNASVQSFRNPNSSPSGEYFETDVAVHGSECRSGPGTRDARSRGFLRVGYTIGFAA